MVAACPFPASRGTPVRIQQMGEALHASGYDVHVATYHLGQARPVPDLIIHRTRGISFYRDYGAGPNYSKLLLLDPMLVACLARIVRLYRIRIIHAHHFEGALCALLVKRIHGGLQVIYDAHTSLNEELFDYHFRIPRIVKKVACDILDSGIPRWCDHVVAVSDQLKNEILAHGVPESKVTVIPLAVNLGDFPLIDKSRARSTLGLDGSPTVVYTGNLAPFQGVDHLMRAMAIVRDRMPSARLVLVSAPNRHYGEMVRKLNLERHVSFAGDKSFEDVRVYLAAADVVVLPRGHATGFPLKLLNYMAAGKAIVAFEGSSMEAIQHLHSGYVVKGESEGEFAAGILRCLTDANLSSHMGGAARRAVDSYDLATVNRRVQDLYRSLETRGFSCDARR